MDGYRIGIEDAGSVEFRTTYVYGLMLDFVNDNSTGRSDLGVNTGKIASGRSGPYLWYFGQRRRNLFGRHGNSCTTFEGSNVKCRTTF